ncbi:uncharacterized protein VNE69_08070 [Vairimorpha necatrix]|uniref:Uncharacterized protein n=1 Tax=Vairimorpha necatrix TaxID=6039 RepID=A0AAX4JEQ7_9MICR
MVEINSNLMKYKSIKLASYLNDKFPLYEKSVLQIEKDKISSIKSNMETEIFKIFIQNSDSLLDILYSYESVYLKLNELKDLTFHTNFQNEKILNVNKKKLESFKAILKNFTTDLSSFDTGTRILEHFEFLDDFILLMTNDILIIGKKNGREYSLINTFNYSIIEMYIKNELKIKMGETELSFKGEKVKLIGILDKFKELSYNYENSVTEDNKIINKDEDLEEYYLETERYDKLSSRNFTIQKNINFFIDIKILENFSKKNQDFLIFFLKYKFNENLLRISKCKPLLQLIDEVFEYFYKFFDEEKKIYKKINIKILLLIEDHILTCFKYFEKRLINRRFYSVTLDDIFKDLRSKLKFKNFDFSYLIEYFTDEMRKQNEKFLNQTKNEIKKIIREFLE